MDADNDCVASFTLESNFENVPDGSRNGKKCPEKMRNLTPDQAEIQRLKNNENERIRQEAQMVDLRKLESFVSSHINAGKKLCKQTVLDVTAGYIIYMEQFLGDRDDTLVYDAHIRSEETRALLNNLIKETLEGDSGSQEEVESSPSSSGYGSLYCSGGNVDSDESSGGDSGNEKHKKIKKQQMGWQQKIYQEELKKHHDLMEKQRQEKLQQLKTDPAQEKQRRLQEIQLLLQPRQLPKPILQKKVPQTHRQLPKPILQKKVPQTHRQLPKPILQKKLPQTQKPVQKQYKKLQPKPSPIVLIQRDIQHSSENCAIQQKQLHEKPQNQFVQGNLKSQTVPRQIPQLQTANYSQKLPQKIGQLPNQQLQQPVYQLLLPKGNTQAVQLQSPQLLLAVPLQQNIKLQPQHHLQQPLNPSKLGNGPIQTVTLNNPQLEQIYYLPQPPRQQVELQQHQPLNQQQQTHNCLFMVPTVSNVNTFPVVTNKTHQQSDLTTPKSGGLKRAREEVHLEYKQPSKALAPSFPENSRLPSMTTLDQGTPQKSLNKAKLVPNPSNNSTIALPPQNDFQNFAMESGAHSNVLTTKATTTSNNYDNNKNNSNKSSTCSGEFSTTIPSTSQSPALKLDGKFNIGGITDPAITSLTSQNVNNVDIEKSSTAGDYEIAVPNSSQTITTTTTNCDVYTKETEWPAQIDKEIDNLMDIIKNSRTTGIGSDSCPFLHLNETTSGFELQTNFLDISFGGLEKTTDVTKNNDDTLHTQPETQNTEMVNDIDEDEEEEIFGQISFDVLAN